MYDGLARWLFDFRSQILSCLAALTIGAAFIVLQIGAPKPSFAPHPPADPGIRATSALYESTFPRTRSLSLYVESRGAPRLDSAEGEAWLQALEQIIAAVPDKSGSVVTRGILEEGPLRWLWRIDPDGRAGVLRAALRGIAVPDLSGLPAALGELSLNGPGGRALFRAVLLEPPPPPEAITPLLERWVPEAIGIGLLAAGLLAYSGSFVLTGLVLFAGFLAVLWQAGLWILLGGSLDAGQRFVVPFIVALVLGHAFPLSRHVMRGLNAGASPAVASLSLMRWVAPAGAPSLLAAALALLAGATIPIAAARETLLFAALGVLLALPALFIVLPLLMSLVRVDKPPPEALPEPRPRRRPRNDMTLRQAAAGPQAVVILALALGLVAALESHGRLLGPVDAAALSSAVDPAWIETANAAAAAPGTEQASIVILARTSPQACTRFDVLDAVDRLAWQIANIPGVSAVEALPLTLRALNADEHGGDPRWREMPREPVGALKIMVKVPQSAALIDRQCRTLTIRAYATPPIANVLSQIDKTVSAFGQEANTGPVTFALAGGPLANALAEQRLLQRHQSGIILALLTVLMAAGFFGLADWRAAGAMLIMGLALVLACGWAVAALPLGITGRTTPLLLLAIILSADMALYVVMGWRTSARVASVNPDPRRRLWQRDGRALLVRSLAMCVCFSVWLFGSDPLQRHLGVLAIVTTLAAMMTALFVIPAFSMLVERGVKREGLDVP